MATILVVDDEAPIRQLVARILERKGYTVIQCGDGASALAVTDSFDLLVVDFVLPDMNGREVTSGLRQTRPTLPVIMMSGYLPDPELAPPPPSTFLQKPMPPASLVEAVEQMIKMA